MSTENLITINVDVGETRIALIENGLIAELLVERSHFRSRVGNIYKGKVSRILPGMQAAFIDIGLEKHGFLHSSDICDDSMLENKSGKEGKKSRGPTPIEKRLKEGQHIVVQVSKDQIGTKGCRITADISIPGRHLVYMPMSNKGGVSRKIENEKERKRLGKIISKLNTRGGALIARTVACDASADALDSDAAYLADVWEETLKQFTKRKTPGVLYSDLSLPLRVARDKFNDSVDHIIVDDKSVYQQMRNFVDKLDPARYDDIELYTSEQKIFDAFGIESEIRRAMDRVVELPSGGTLVIDQGEALTAVDVNTGKFVGKGFSKQEKTIVKTNMEAVEEIAYQMRFRNIGGLIVLDLIDMNEMSDRNKVVSRLKECLKNDKAKSSVNAISRFGLVEMTRERVTESLGRMLHEKCPYCDGTGHILSRITIANEVLREIERQAELDRIKDLEVKVHPNVADALRGDLNRAFKTVQKRIGKKVRIVEDKLAHVEHFNVYHRRS